MFTGNRSIHRYARSVNWSSNCHIRYCLHAIYHVSHLMTSIKRAIESDIFLIFQLHWKHTQSKIINHSNDGKKMFLHLKDRRVLWLQACLQTPCPIRHTQNHAQTVYPIPYNMVDSITVTSSWPRWRLKSLACRLCTQPSVQAQIKGNIKASGAGPQKMFPFDDVIMYPIPYDMVNSRIMVQFWADIFPSRNYSDVTWRLMTTGITSILH